MAAKKSRGRRFKKASYQAFKERPAMERQAILMTNDSLKEVYAKWLHEAPESEEYKILDEQMMKRGLKERTMTE